MLGISKACQKMKKKIAFGDYTFSKDLEVAKARKTYMLTKEDGEKIKEIFSKRLGMDFHTSVNGLLSEAIQLLYKQEIIDG